MTAESFQPRTLYGRILKRVYSPKYRDLTFDTARGGGD